MDQELIPFLESYFSRIDARFNQIDTRFSQIDAHFSQIDAHFSQIDARFNQIDAHLRRVEEKADNTQILLEDMRDHIRILAEGFIGYSEKLDLVKSELMLKIDEVRVMVIPYYQDLDRRLRVVEGWADRQNRDILELVRERVLGARQQPL